MTIARQQLEGPWVSWRLRRQALSWGKEMLHRWQPEEVFR